MGTEAALITDMAAELTPTIDSTATTPAASAAARALVHSTVIDVSRKLLSSFLGQYPGIWHVIEKGLDGRAWVVDMRTGTIHPTERQPHAAEAIHAFLFPTDHEQTPA